MDAPTLSPREASDWERRWTNQTHRLTSFVRHRYFEKLASRRRAPERDDGFIKIETAAEHVFFFTPRDDAPTGRDLIKWFVLATITNNKQRFQLLATDGRITHVRATQGHSTKTIDPTKIFTRVTEVPEYFYHGTFYQSVDDILYYGLKPGGCDFDPDNEESSRTFSHFSPFLPRDRRCIAGMRKNTLIIIHYEASKVATELGAVFWKSAAGAILTESVLPGRSVRYITDWSSTTDKTL